MILKIFLNHKWMLLTLPMVFILGITSCRPRMIKPSPEPVRLPIPGEQFPEQPATEPEQQTREPDPRMLASLQLTQNARALIENGEPDSAIRILERAVALHPSNGQNYYYLSQAWLIKKNVEQARNFNELAIMHLGADEAWQQRLERQRERIRQLADAK